MSAIISYTGWIRGGLRGRWRLFCRAATEQACLNELLDKAPPGSDKLVRQGDADPNEDGRLPFASGRGQPSKNYLGGH